MRESHFHQEWIDSWRYHFPECHIAKIPDTIKSAAARFMPLKPYDIYAVLCGKFYAMELKLMTKLQGFSFGMVTEWQVNNLIEVAHNGATSYVVINYRAPISERQQKKFEIQHKKFNSTFVITAENFDYLDKTTPSKSISFETFLGQGKFNGFIQQLDWIDGHWNVPMITP